MASSERTAELIIKARDEFSRVLKNLDKQQSDLAKKTKQASVVLAGRAEIKEAQQNYINLTAQLKRYQDTIRAGRASGKLSEAELREIAEAANLVRARMQEAVGAINQKRQALNAVSNSAKTGFLRFNEVAKSMERTTVAATRTTAAVNQQSVAVNKDGAAMNVLAKSTDRATVSQRRLETQTKKTAAAAATSTARGARTGAAGNDQDITMWGLRPWQLTNLGYQVNDVVSGFAMGQQPMQIFAQQAGQIAQIWPNVMVTLARSITVLGPLAAALSPVVAALVRLRTEANTLSFFTSNLALSADGARYSAAALADLTKELTELGVGVNDARKSVLALVKEGFSPEQIKAIGEMGKQLSNITGESYADEMDRLSKAFANGAGGIRELDKELNFLTADQLENIYTLERQGRGTEALAVAQQALSARLGAAQPELTKFGEAVENVKDAWNTLVEALTDSGFVTLLGREIGRFIEDIAAITEDISKLVNFVNTMFKGPSLSEQIAQSEARIQALRADLSGENLNDNARMLGFDDPNNPMNQRTQQQLDEELKRLEALNESQRMLEKAARDQQRALEENTGALTGRSEADKKEEVDEKFSPGSLVTGNLSGVVDRIVGIESGGNPNAKNPLSSATGLGQFISSTWLSMFKQYFPDRAAGMSDAMILELRKNADLSRKMVELYAQENQKIFEKAGVAVTDAALYLGHFLGPQGALAVLQADADTAVSSILGAGQINANKSILQGKTAGQVVNWAAGKMGTPDAQMQIEKQLNDMATERLNTEKAYREEYQKRIADQKFELEMMREDARRAYVTKALRDEELKAKEAGVILTKAEKDAVTQLAVAKFDQENAEVRINELMERRQLLAQSLQIAQDSGDGARVQEIIGQMQDLEVELDEAFEATVKFYEALGGPAADQAIAKLRGQQEALTSVVDKMGREYLPTAEDLNKQLTDMAGASFGAFAQAIAQGENAFEAFKNAVLSGIAEMLISIGEAIVKQAIWNSLTGGGANPGGGFGGAVSGWLTSMFHSGGIVGGSGSGSKTVDPSIFAGAKRYHNGGLVSGEVPIIAEMGEEVLTADDPRHRNNGGGGVNVKNVNVFDPADVLEQSLSTEAGQKVILNFMSKNPRKMRKALGM